MWLENAKHILISYINVQLFPRVKKNKNKQEHICKCPQKVSDKSGPKARDHVVKTVGGHEFALAKQLFPGGCEMCPGLKENTHCFMPLCGF